MTMPLQDMIDSVLSEAQEKIASVNQEEVAEEIPQAQPETEQIGAGVDPSYAEKLAGAVEYISEHLDSIINPSADVPSLREALKEKVSEAQPEAVAEEAVTEEPTEEAVEETIDTKTAGADREELKRAILEKLGSGVDNPPKIANKASSGPEGASVAGEGPSGSGPGGHELVGAVEKAISYTKGDAKKGVKADLAKVLDHPALSKAKDPVLHENLQNASKAGVKIAGTREALRKATENSELKEEISSKLSAIRSAE